MSEGPIFKGLRRNLRRQFPGEKIEIWRGQSGKPARFSVGTREGGGVTGIAERGALRIKSSGVPEKMQGKGRGSKLYAGLARAARGSNRSLESDGEVSAQAQRRYKGLARSGNKVFYGGRRAYTDTGNRRPDGKSFTRDGKAAFVVNPATKPKGYRRVFKAIQTGGRVMADPLVELDEAIEKAGLIRGGSKSVSNRIGRIGLKGLKDGDTSRFSRAANAQRYLSERTKGGTYTRRVPKGDSAPNGLRGKRRTGVYKSNEPSPLEALDSAIEKARGLLPSSKKGGSARVYNRMVDRAVGAMKRYSNGDGSGRNKKNPTWSATDREARRANAAQKYLATRTRRK